MFLRIVQIGLIFLVSLLVVNYAFNFGNDRSAQVSGISGGLFSRNLPALLAKGDLVVVDDKESDKYIQESLSTHDLKKAMTFARYKAEVLERPLFIESKVTYGNPDVVATVNPTDRKAWQELTLAELHLKEDYEKKHPGDLSGYQSQKALDAQKTPEVMAEFINSYPETNSAITALAHIEYCLCNVRKVPDKAIAMYESLKKTNAKQTALCGVIDQYISRAQDYKNVEAQ